MNVSLVDTLGDAIPSVAVLVSNPDGQIGELTSTGPSGSVVVSVPNHGRVSVFHNISVNKRAFSAEVVEGMTELTFQRPAELGNPILQIGLSASCAVGCGSSRELSVSCLPAEVVGDTTSPYSASVQTYYGCPGSNVFDAFMVSYDASGNAVGATSSDSLPLTDANYTLPSFTTVTSVGRADLSLEIQGLLGGFSASRRVMVPNGVGPGFGFSRIDTTDDPLVTFSLVKAFVPEAWVSFSVQTTPQQAITRFDHLPTFDDDASLTFDVGSLAIPALPGTVDLTTPGQPLAPFQLGQGPIGDAIQLTLAADSSLIWHVALPAAQSGEVLFPELPTALAGYAITNVSDFSIGHVDMDDLDGYASWASETIVQPLEVPARPQTASLSQ
ncbi:MAG: hypothetical protein JNK04_23175 [Myxococcales bacterium]|nr:hypothetical protein [Myxococcales bacterium]